MEQPLSPKEIKIYDDTYVISKMPATEAGNILDILSVDVYLSRSSSALSLANSRVLNYAYVQVEGGLTPLSSTPVVNKYVHSWDQRSHLISAILGYSTHFLDDGMKEMFFINPAEILKRRLKRVSLPFLKSLLLGDMQPSESSKPFIVSKTPTTSTQSQQDSTKLSKKHFAIPKNKNVKQHLSFDIKEDA
jgi:hypothetical protein